jgi:sporulation protein YlmC with PRC-barrel domain
MEQIKVTLSVDEFKQMHREAIEGAEVVLEYNSSFGGSQGVTGELTYNHDAFGRSTWQVGDREIANSRVLSANDGRKVGTVESIQLTLNRETAINELTRHYNGHDIDDHGDQVVVQMWNGCDFDRQNEKTLKVT